MAYGYGYGWGFAPYVSVSSRRVHAARETAALRKKGRTLEAVTIEGRTIARSFWGKAWCRNLEVYGDFANRLPRGRSYLANGLVLDLKVAPGLVTALVYGTELYQIEISVTKLAEGKWAAIRSECAGKIDSLVELLSGRLSQAVMTVVTRPGAGLFPAPAEIRMDCSCPDSARLCKHLAAALYGIGARLDHHPELLFLLRQVDHLELVTAAVEGPVAGSAAPDDALAGADLSSIFGIDLEEAPKPARTRGPKTRGPDVARALAVPPPSPAATARTRPLPPRVRAPAATRHTKTTRELKSTDLVSMGISRATIRNWLLEGVLTRTATKGVYGRTKETKRRIELYLGRR